MVKFKGSANQEKIPSWLKTIQENSWEAELLLSAVLLFGLIQTPIYIETWSKQLFAWEGGLLIGVIQNIITGIEILRIGFIIHIIVRAMWIAQVGFSYVFPKGIQVDKLGFKGKFKTELEKGDTTIESILSLEKIASTIFAISFSLFGLLIGLLGFFSPFIIIGLLYNGVEINESLEGGILVAILFYLFFGIPLFIDFVTNGVFRRHRIISKFYYPIALFFRILTLSFLYKKTLLTIISNVHGYKRYLITIGMIFILIWIEKPAEIIRNYKIDEYSENTKNGYLQKTNYDAYRNNDDLLIATIPSDIISGDVLKIFINKQGIMKSMINLNSQNFTKDVSKNQIDSTKTKKDSTQKDITFSYSSNGVAISQSVGSISKLIDVYIDSVKVDHSNWLVTVHPTAYAKGYTSYLDISLFSNTQHSLKISIKSAKEDSLIANIPFYKTN